MRAIPKATFRPSAISLLESFFADLKIADFAAFRSSDLILKHVKFRGSWSDEFWEIEHGGTPWCQAAECP